MLPLLLIVARVHLARVCATHYKAPLTGHIVHSGDQWCGSANEIHHLLSLITSDTEWGYYQMAVLPIIGSCILHLVIPLIVSNESQYVKNYQKLLTEQFFFHIPVETVSPSSAPNGPIRLWRNGHTSLSYTSGRVQLVYNRQWGNICDDAEFGLAEASVICHQLGYTGAINWTNAQSDV